MAKTTNEKIEGIQSQIQQLQNEQKRLMNLQKEAERKARTKRLIERGAIAEAFVPEAAALTNDEFKAALTKLLRVTPGRD